MGLLIKRTGLEQYAPGGNARIKVMIIGGPSVGKTRWASYFDRPFYLDIENGLASVADRGVPYATINNSQDMADALQYLKVETRKPDDKRDYNTVVVDTLDAYQRKLKNEWQETKRVDSFTGWEAWGFLTQRMQSLLTKLLNLDMNIIVNVHYKDKVTRDDDTGRETHEFMLQLQGETADNAFNDFDLVGWMESDWEAVDGKRELVRWISFEKTPQKMFLKDRLHVMQGKIPVTFSDADYKLLQERIASRMDEMGENEELGEIPTFVETAPGVVAPGASKSTIAPRSPREAPLETLDKPSLQAIANEEGVRTDATGKPLRNNSLKSEYIQAIKHHRNTQRPAVAPVTPPAVVPPPVQQPSPPKAPAAAPYRENVPAQTVKPVAAPEGLVNPKTGELLTPEQTLEILQREHGRATDKGDAEAAGRAQQALEKFAQSNPDLAERAAVRTAEEILGAQEIEDRKAPTKAMNPTEVVAPGSQGATCEHCGKPMNDPSENTQYHKLAWIKFRKKLCNQGFQELMNAKTGN